MTFTIPGYTILEEMREGKYTAAYRAFRDKDHTPVILKTPKAEQPILKNTAQLQHEYEITKNLDIAGVIKPIALEVHRQRPVLILEDFGGKALSTVITNDSLDLTDFMEIAIQLTGTLGEIHQHQIIHKDIKPSNIIVAPQTIDDFRLTIFDEEEQSEIQNLKSEIQGWQVKITDFGIASRLSRENPNVSSPNMLEGTLAYISPEQTGRMNRSVDYRTDFYSLGVTFYEMLTGQLPFQAVDPLGMVHAHIAKQPLPPIALKPEIPPVLSAIIMKLLAKTAEERYQSAYGLKADLEKCLTQTQNLTSLEDMSGLNFEIGQHDISDRFEIPQKLYGREQEITTLLAAFDRVSQGATEMMLVYGYSGIGKSSLIHEIHKPIARGTQGGYFISGKFDQYKRNVPYASFIQAFQDLVRQILTESDDKVVTWKERLLNVLGPNGQVIIDVIPEVELITGPQPPIPTLPPAETQNRFNLVFQNFARILAGAEHPLAISLDDLQWADAASLKLIQLLMTDANIRYLLMIGAYRDNEVMAAHPLMLTLNGLQEAGATINHIALGPLDLSNINQLIADTLHCPPPKSSPLAELVLSKTAGNPFFVSQFLRSLYTEGQLTFDPGQRSWQWDVAQIRAMGITDNVVELMAGKIQKLTVETQAVIKLAACIGNEFNLQTLAIVHEKSLTATAANLWDALQEGLILAISDFGFQTYNWAEQSGDETTALQPTTAYPQFKFLHDRVQQAAYSLIADDRKKEAHLKIGQLLLKNTGESELEEKIFDIVNQLNIGLDLLTDQTQRYELARLNLMAGKKAKAAIAYEAGLQYLTTGVGLLVPDSWQTHYDLTLALNMERAECEYLTGRFVEAEKAFDLTLTKAKTNLEKARIYHIKELMYTNLGQLKTVVETGLAGLKLLGLDLPMTPEQTQVDQEIDEIKLKLGHQSVADLVDLPVMTDPQQVATIRLLMEIVGPAWWTSNQKLFYLVTAKMVNLSITYGNADASAYGYAFYGVILGSGMGDYETGYEYGRLALTLNEKFDNIQLIPKTHVVFGTFIQPWRTHLKKGVDILKKGYQVGLEGGDLLWTSIDSYVTIYTMLIKGDKLDDVENAIQIYLDLALRTKQAIPTNMLILTQRLILSLKGLTRKPGDFSDQDYDEAKHIQEIQESGAIRPIFWYYEIKLQALYLFAEYAEALKVALESDKVTEAGASFGTVTVVEHYFYYSLVLAALYPAATLKDKEIYRQILTKNLSKLKSWADNCPENFDHKYLLVAADMARLESRDQEAMILYEQAVKSARQNEYIQNEALASEAAGKFYLSKNLDTIAIAYLQVAHDRYEDWGATAKVRALEEKYPQFLAAAKGLSHLPIATIENITVAPASSITSSTTGTDGEAALDLAAVIKASQAISGEIVLDKLLEKLMRLVIENAGAQKGLLILEKDEEWFIEAMGVVDETDVSVLQSTPLNEAALGQNSMLSAAIVNYVIRTKQNVVLNDATREGHFTTDPYIVNQQPKSLLCTPLINQRQLIGLLYLENNLTTGAFTPDRLEVLQLLSGQAAVSIENARLYANIAANERKYRTLFEESKDAIFVTNREGNLIDINQATLDLFGYTRAEMIGVYVRELYADPEVHSRFVEEIKQEGALRDFEVRFLKKDGTVMDCLMTVTIWRADEGHILAFQGIVRDITKQKRAQKLLEDYSLTLEQEVNERTIQLAQATREAEAANQSKSDFLASASHELRTPLTSILGFAKISLQTLEDKLFPKIQADDRRTQRDMRHVKENIEIIVTEGERLTAIINNLLDLAKIEAGKVDWNMQSITLSKVIERAIAATSSLFEQKGLKLIKDLAPDLPEIIGDQDKLIQVVINLISNAVKFTDEGSVTCRAEVTLPLSPPHTGEMQGGEIIVSIIDTGLGIALEDQPKVFEKFKQVGDTLTDKPQGTGLGLPICKEIVEHHGGRIWVDSQPGQGSTFSFALPIQALQKE
jgi:PAS domain S-box-containing protein